jgi:hypothetical protein
MLFREIANNEIKAGKEKSENCLKCQEGKA